MNKTSGSRSAGKCRELGAPSHVHVACFGIIYLYQHMSRYNLHEYLSEFIFDTTHVR